MDPLFDAFRRNPDGSWVCVRSVTFDGPGGRMQVAAGSTFCRGRLFMGVDLARYLEAHAKSGTDRRV
jgi:hypothetical protein